VSIDDLLTDIEHLEARIASMMLKESESEPKVPGWWRRFFKWIQRLGPFL